MQQLTLTFVPLISEKCYYPFSLYLEPETCHKYPLSSVWCRIPTADFWPSPWKICVNEINFVGKLQGASVFMFSKSELFSQAFLKDIGLRCRKLIIQNRTFADQLFVAACDVLDLFVIVSYWESHTLSQRSFLKMFTNYSCLLFFCSLFGLIIFIIWISHDIHATLLWMFLDRTTFWPLWVIMCSLIFLDVDIP